MDTYENDIAAAPNDAAQAPPQSANLEQGTNQDEPSAASLAPTIPQPESAPTPQQPTDLEQGANQEEPSTVSDAAPGASIDDTAPAPPQPTSFPSEAQNSSQPDSSTILAAPPQNTPDFEPWPPPRPTDFRGLNDLFVDHSRFRRLADIQHYLVVSLESVGLQDFSYFNAPGGFALVTPLKRLSSNGSPEINSPNEPGYLTSSDWFRNWLSLLFWCPKGYYGAVVFFVTTDTRGPDMKENVTQDDLENWSIGGVRDLPDNIKNESADNHYIYAAVYNFVQNDEDSPVLLKNNIFDTNLQLSALGIFQKNDATH